MRPPCVHRRQNYIGEMLFVVIGALMSVGLAQVGPGGMHGGAFLQGGAVARMWHGARHSGLLSLGLALLAKGQAT